LTAGGNREAEIKTREWRCPDTSKKSRKQPAEPPPRKVGPLEKKGVEGGRGTLESLWRVPNPHLVRMAAWDERKASIKRLEPMRQFQNRRNRWPGVQESGRTARASEKTSCQKRRVYDETGQTDAEGGKRGRRRKGDLSGEACTVKRGRLGGSERKEGK